uniref:ARM repeat superfamily protein n=1 Tax=Kalanchoe fedtschenkoi TaxID=63787 RepID=A0A7N0TZ88_KALFE
MSSCISSFPVCFSSYRTLAADTEAARGHRGSATLRIEAFFTLRMLVAKIGTADSLAFFLPGVISQFAKVLHISKSMISGAGGSSKAVDQAARGLAEYLMIVLEDDMTTSGLDTSSILTTNNSRLGKSSQSVLDALRHMPVKDQAQLVTLPGASNGQETHVDNPIDFRRKETVPIDLVSAFTVSRSEEWKEKTASQVNKLLIATFPHLCVHPSKNVRIGVLVAVQGLLTRCYYTLKHSRVMFMECLCTLVCDDSNEVSKTAQEFLEQIIKSSRKYEVENDIIEILNCLIEKLPKVVFGNEESVVVSNARQLLVIIYYSGPNLIANHFLRSPVTASKLLDTLALCLSQNSLYAGSFDKLISSIPSTMGYLPALTELSAVTQFSKIRRPAPLEAPKSQIVDTGLESVEYLSKVYELPRMPPWFNLVGSQNLYRALASTLRLVCLSALADFQSEGLLSIVVDIPLGYLRNLVSEIRTREYTKESWRSWHYRTGSGRLLREASTAVCMLNEMIYGLSDEALNTLRKMLEAKEIGDERPQHQACNGNKEHRWSIKQKSRARNQLISCIGNILHEYLCPEIWNLPLELRYDGQTDDEFEEVNMHFFQDIVMLHQVIIDGIGVFNICLGDDFTASGFLQSSLFVLLENLICSKFEIRRSADAVLHVLTATAGHPTVGHLVTANSDYIIDSICRQLRHLDIHPHVASVLAVILSFVGVARNILPLLDEPLRSISAELEILGRHRHPNLSLPFLKAIAEIVNASKGEACSMLGQAELHSTRVSSKIRQAVGSSDGNTDMPSTESVINMEDDELQLQQLENMILELNDFRRYRRIVGSIAGSCLTTGSPLLASEKQMECLVALDIVQDGITTLAKIEATYRIENRTKEAIEEEIQSRSSYDLQDTLDAAASEDTDENRLLPAMNKIWPLLVVCVENSNPVVVRRCLDVVAHVVQVCGGDFFSRRFHVDGPHFWKLLTTSPFHTKPLHKDPTPLQLPYRKTTASVSFEDRPSEISSLKVQVQMLNMIANISRNKKSASAFTAVLKKLSGLVVGIACSGVAGLRDASINALSGLASIDPDLIWLLMADVYYYLNKSDSPAPPSAEFPELTQILPPPASQKDLLYVQYGGRSFGFDINLASVEYVFRQLHSQVFSLSKCSS